MTERKVFPLRLDPAVYDALKRWADDELRSVNGQIEYLLSQALRQAGRAPARRGSAESHPSGEVTET